MNSFDNHKTLGRALQSLLKEMFHVRDCVVMFKDLRRDQFFNIVYADDDDRKNTFNASLQKRKDAIKALKDEGAAKNRDRIQSELAAIQRMQRDEKFEEESRNLVVSESQMIYIPKNTGITNLVVEQNRLIYLNHFKFSKFSNFMPGTDNILSLREISDMVIAPMLDHTGQASGLFYFYNSA